jgi:hypothetical protein
MLDRPHRIKCSHGTLFFISHPVAKPQKPTCPRKLGSSQLTERALPGPLVSFVTIKFCRSIWIELFWSSRSPWV